MKDVIDARVGASSRDFVSSTARTKPSAPSGIEAPIGITATFFPSPRNLSATDSTVVARSSRLATRTTSGAEQFIDSEARRFQPLIRHGRRIQNQNAA